MEYSPMMVLMLWALTPSDCLPIDGEPSEQARVVEMAQPIMSVHPEGYFTFNHGRPFLAERDPLTGAIDSNIKTTPVTSDDYLYEEYEESGESIDRKDNSGQIYTRNDITSPSKDSDLHKFLNLPVHYSSSGKFPLISSSYANTKVQGHGPLSNHKLFTSSTSTTTTVSPSYYTLKTRPTSSIAPKSTATPRATTTTTTTSTPSTTTTTTPYTKRVSTTVMTSTTSPPARVTTTTTTTKPYVPNYEYEYEYDYDKNDGDSAENSSHDYEFLGSSSEVTNSYEKASTTRNPLKVSSTPNNVHYILKEQTSTYSSTDLDSSATTTTVRAITAASAETKTTTYPTSSIMKSTLPAKGETNSKYPLTEKSTPKQEETFDLKPPKPGLSVELKPPQLHPTRPFSSVVSMKPQTFAPSGFIRYPESPLVLGDKKPFTVYSPQNSTKNKPVLNPTQVSADDQRPQVGKQNVSSPSIPHAGSLIQSKPTNRDSVETNLIKTQNQNRNQTEFLSEGVNVTKKPSLQADKEIQQEVTNVSEKPTSLPSLNSSIEKPIDNHKLTVDDTKRPSSVPQLDKRRPQNPIHHNIYDDLLTSHNKNQELLPNNKPQNPYVVGPGFQGVSFGTNRPPQDSRPQATAPEPTKSSYLLQESNIPQGVHHADIMKVQRPQESVTEHSRVPIHFKPDNNRQEISHLAHNKPLIHHLPHEHNNNRPPYQWLDHNRPPPKFGLRITERPIPSDRVPPMEHHRPNGIGKPQTQLFESIKNVNDPEVRPHHSLTGGEVRPIEGNLGPETNLKPVIFSKPQSGKRPDYNTVQFGQPSKVENHFISVSPGNDNPSYSLQTSFSIGVPPPEQKQTPNGASHGVGQVLFPDEESEKRPPVWPPPHLHQRPPPQVSQSDPHPNLPVEKYPRPPWESHLKHPHVYHKKEQFPPIKRKPLPNILPQFRPNAKIGHAEPHIYLKPREPYDTLQPPPLPRPQFLRLEQDLEETKPLVHRRNGQSSSRVTTLQMMQGPPTSKRAALRVDDTNEKNEPVFVVYPSNGNSAPAPPTDGVVVGTRGPQRPLPPDNLDIGDDLDSFPLDSNKNFQARVDTPVLKSKTSTSKPPIKVDFPYTLIKPVPEERVSPGSIVTKEYTAFSPTVPSTEKDNDAEINIIPYLQDYMPFATKKPTHKDTWLHGTDVKHISAPAPSKQPPFEITSSPPYKHENHKEVSEGPQPQDFQAPFHASLTAPSQGWSVVQKKPNKEKTTEEMTTSKELNEIQTTEEPKFDIQNFKPQLFGGFKPIVPPVGDKEKKDT